MPETSAPHPIRSSDLVRHIERAVHREGGAVLVGQAGIGKSHVARIIGSRLRARKVAVEFVLATSAASAVPFGAMAGLLESAPEAAGDLLEVLRTAGDRLVRRAQGRGLLVIVDDAHRLDPASAALLLSLVTRHHIRVLATVRIGADVPDAVVALWKDAGLPRVDLEPLSEGAAGKLVRELLGGPVERTTLSWLWEASDGVPLFLSELVQSAVQQQALAEQRGYWRRVAPLALPARVLDLLDNRIDSLDDEQRRAMALIVLAEPASLELLVRLGAIDAARTLERRGLVSAVRAVGGAGLRTVHPLYAEAMRASLGATEARDLHAALAAELDPGDSAMVLRMATWALDDGVVGDPEAMLAATEAALEGFDPETAIRLGEAAAVARPGPESALALARALRAVGRFDEAEGQLAAVEREALTHPCLTTYLFVRAMNLIVGLRRSEDAFALLARVEVQPARTAVEAASLSSVGRRCEAVSCARQAVDAASEDHLAASIAAVVLGGDLALIGDPLGALEALDRVDAEVGAIESEWPRAAVAMIPTLFAGEQWAERRARLVERHAQARDAGDDARAALCEVAFCRLALPAGELAYARRMAQDALTRLVFMDPRRMAPTCYALLAEVEALSGRPVQARDALERGHEFARRLAARGTLSGILALAAVAVRAAEGDTTGAQEAALAAATAAEGRKAEAILVEAELRHLFLRVGGDPAAVADRLAEIAAATQAGIVQLWADQAGAARDGDGAALELVADAYEAIGARLFAAEAAAQAATVFADRGSDDARKRAQGRAHRLAAECGADGLVLVGATRLTALTAREQQTARLVALGLSNAEIAQRLSLSVRTVEAHVYRATTKLGVHDRAALARTLARSDQPST